MLLPDRNGESWKFILNEIMYEIIAPIVYHAYKMNNIDISVPNLLSDLPRNCKYIPTLWQIISNRKTCI